MEPRYEGVDGDHVAWMLTKLDEHIDGILDEVEYLLHRDYLARAQLRFAAGFHPDEVHHDLLWAARCLRFQEHLHFIKVPAERFRSRRIDPVELGVGSGDMLLATQIAERYGLPLPLIVAHMADDDLMREVRTVTRLFDGPPRDAIDVAGLAAVCWSAALGAAVRGFTDEAAMAVELVDRAVADSPFGREDEGPLRRYRRLFAALRALLEGDAGALAAALSRLLADHEAALREGMTEEEWEKPPVAPRYFDVAAVALSALFALRGHHLDVSALEGDATRYACLLEVQEVAPVEPEEVEEGEPAGAGAAADADRAE